MRFLSILILLALPFAASAQYNLATTYYAHNDLNASRYEPSELDLGDKKFQIGLNYNIWAGNNTITYGDILSILDASQGVVTFDDLYSKIKTENYFGVGQDIQLFGLAYQYKTKGDKRFDLSLSVVDRFATTIMFPENTLKLIMKGNAQFAGENVNIGGFEINTHYMREFAVGFAMPLMGNNGHEDGFGVRIGGRAKYIQGVGAIKTVKSDAYMHTASDGTFIDVDFDYELQTAGVDPNNFSFFNQNGTGFGLDLGAAMYFGKNIEVNASLTDIGAVSYNKNVNTYRKQGLVSYEGAIVSELFGDVNFQDSTTYIFSPEIDGSTNFSVALPTKLLLQAEFKTSKTTKKDDEYVSNAIFVTYVQGFSNVAGTTTRPYVSVAYNHDFHKFLDAGLMASYGGFNQFGLGAFLSLNILNTVKFGVGSDNLLPIVVPTLGTGVAGSFNLSVSF